MTSKYRCPVCGEENDNINSTLLICKSCGYNGSQDKAVRYAITIAGIAGSVGGSFTVINQNEKGALLSNGDYAGLGDVLRITTTPAGSCRVYTVVVAHTGSGIATQTFTSPANPVDVTVDGTLTITVTCHAQVTFGSTFAHGTVTLLAYISNVLTSTSLVSATPVYIDDHQTVTVIHTPASGYKWAFDKISATFYLEETQTYAIVTSNVSIVTTFATNASFDEVGLTLCINVNGDTTTVQTWAGGISGTKALSAVHISTDLKRFVAVMSS